MGNIKYLVYINGQSSKPLVNSLEEAKRYATSKISYKPSLRIECYSAPSTACEWMYDYTSGKWVKTVDRHKGDLCCLAVDCKAA